MITVAETLKNLEAAIRLSYEDTETTFVALELLSDITGKTKTQLLSSLKSPLTPQAIIRLSKRLDQIAKRVPVQYILGFVQFYGNKFKVSKEVLIPRQETETLVETAVSRLLAKALSSKKALNVLDIGTGSGAITISIANTCSRLLEKAKQISFYAVDISAAALRAAADNSRTVITEKDWLAQLHFIHADLYPESKQATPQRFDIITANLPYVSTDEYKSLKAHIKKYEPKQALFGGKTGTEIVERMLDGLKPRLKPSGVAIIELPPIHEKWLRKKCESLMFSTEKVDQKGFIWVIQPVRHRQAQPLAQHTRHLQPDPFARFSR